MCHSILCDKDTAMIESGNEKKKKEEEEERKKTKKKNQHRIIMNTMENGYGHH